MIEENEVPEPFCRFYLLEPAIYEALRTSMDVTQDLSKTVTGQYGIAVRTESTLPSVEDCLQHDGMIVLPVTRQADPMLREAVADLLASEDAIEITEEEYKEILNDQLSNN